MAQWSNAELDIQGFPVQFPMGQKETHPDLIRTIPATIPLHQCMNNLKLSQVKTICHHGIVVECKTRVPEVPS